MPDGSTKIPEMPNKPPITNYEYYTVQKGDTLYSISSRYFINVEELKRQILYSYFIGN